MKQSGSSVVARGQPLLEKEERTKMEELIRKFE